MNSADYRFYLEYDVFCFGRTLYLDWNDERISEAQMRNTAEEYYDQWFSCDNIWGCEEWILYGINKLGIPYEYAHSHECNH